MRSHFKLPLTCLFSLICTLLCSPPALAWTWLWGKDLKDVQQQSVICPGVRLGEKIDPETPETPRTMVKQQGGSLRDLDLSATETRLLCGDPESYAWQKVSPLQAQYFAKSFLQMRGYLNPEFDARNSELIIYTGPLVRAVDLEVQGAPPDFDVDRKRNIEGRALTPDLLNEVEAWAKSRAQEIGFACAEVEVKASPQTGIIQIMLKPGPAYFFGEIENEGLVTKPGLVERNHAFIDGQLFDYRLLNLSSQRLTRGELYISSYFDLRCPNDSDKSEKQDEPFSIFRHLVPATPRLLTFGVGVDTEVGPVIRSSFRHVLLTPKGTQSQVQVTASYREQKFEAQMDFYPLDDLRSRFHLEPRFQVRRELEEQYESVTTSLGVSPAVGLETTTAEHRLSFGPAFENVDLQDFKSGPRKSAYVFFNLQALSKSHLFEYYAAEPQEGWQVSTSVGSRVNGLASPTTLHRVQVDIQALWNLRHYDPPLLVIGSRTKLGTFIFEDQVAGLAEVPVSQRFFLGGDGDIRGYARKQLPFDESGYLTAISQSFELRWVEILPWKLQPLILFDLAKGSSTPQKLNRGIFFSPGIGLRWSSPLGPIRSTLARGEIWDDPGSNAKPHWQWFVSFGKEF